MLHEAGGGSIHEHIARRRVDLRLKEKPGVFEGGAPATSYASTLDRECYRSPEG